MFFNKLQGLFSQAIRRYSRSPLFWFGLGISTAGLYNLANRKYFRTREFPQDYIYQNINGQREKINFPAQHLIAFNCGKVTVIGQTLHRRGTLYCPIPLKINPNASQLALNRLSWLMNMGFGSKQKVTEFDARGQYWKLAAYTLPTGDYNKLYLYNAFLSFLYAHDNEMDERSCDPVYIQKRDMAIIRFLREGIKETIGRQNFFVRAISDIRKRILAIVPISAMERVLSNYERSFQCSFIEAEQRAKKIGLLETVYTALRDYAGGVPLCIDFCFMLQGGLKTDAVERDVLLQEAVRYANRAVCYANDIGSLVEESKNGVSSNLIIARADGQNWSIQRAHDWTVMHHNHMVYGYLFLRNKLLKNHQDHNDYLTYERVFSICDAWISGNLAWTLESPRFGMNKGKITNVPILSGNLHDRCNDVSTPATIPRSYASLITRCWAQRSASRPTIEAAVKELDGCRVECEEMNKNSI